MMDIRGEYRKKSVREKAEEVQFHEILRGDFIRQMRLTDPGGNKQVPLADAEAGDIVKYSPISGYAETGIRDPFNSPITPRNTCHFCEYNPPRGANTLLRCSACKAVKYCDRDCQSKDWKFHKKGCALIRSDPKGLGDKMIAST